MKKYLNKNELIINFKINRLIKKRDVIKRIGGSPRNYDLRIKALEDKLRRD